MNDPVVVARGVHFAYGAHEVLRGVDLTVPHGEFVALVGANGSGKSTLLRVLLGRIEPSAGSVSLFGAAPRDVRDRWRIGYVAQRPTLAPDLPASVREIVASGLVARGRWWGRGGDRAAVDAALDAVGLADAGAERARDLSGGQQQRVFIAKALVCGPELLILDEPTAGVDAAAQRDFREALLAARERGATILLVSHELSAVADDLDRIAVLRETIVFDGPPGDLSRAGVHLGVHAHDLPLWLEGRP